MNQEEAIATLEESCKTISLQLMKIHPPLAAIENDEVKALIIKHAHQITTDVEVIKKHLLKLKNRDDSTDL